MKIISTTNAPAAIGPYSQAMVCGNMLFTSGQIAIDPATGNVVEGGIVEQTEQIMKNLGAVLEAAGVGSGFNAYWSDSPVYNLWQFVEEDDMFPPVEDAPADIADKVFFIQNVNTGHFLNVHGEWLGNRS